jgi:fructose-1,6-bisphosphatase
MEFEKPPNTLTCFARKHILYSDPTALPLLHGEGDLCRLLDAIQTSCKIINRKVQRSLANVLVSSDQVSGKAINDSFAGGLMESRAFAHETLSHYMSACGQICLASSEINPDELIFPQRDRSGQFSVVFDPLDGFANVEATMATIFGVYRRLEGDAGDEDILQAPRRLLVGGYCLYGSTTTFVMAMAGSAPAAFTLDQTIGEFVLAQEGLAVPPRAAAGICAVDETHALLDGGLERCANERIRTHTHGLEHSGCSVNCGVQHHFTQISRTHLCSH